MGAEELADDMQNGNLNFDRVIATPDMMGVVGRIGKILGPKGLMQILNWNSDCRCKSSCRSC